MAKDVLKWLAEPDNTDWLLIFDNVDQDYQQGGMIGAYNIANYLPADHGSILITTRLRRLEELGTSKRLSKAKEDLAKAIFEKWCGSELGKATH
ncbi:hypothetical protein KJ359_010379 [Pestalotiopsis sp. 9143b]|nr:hypothetical protein KJ359_010379 [Pestalotiopsis sp. 9143b]